MLRKIARDNTTIILLVALLLLGLFVVWQVARLSSDGGTSTHLSIASAVAGSSSVPATVAALEGTAVSRPRLPLQRWQTSNGARVYFVAAPELPMLDVRVLFDAGSARDHIQPGLARLTAAMIGEGTPSHSVDAINEGFESVGADFSASSHRDMAVVQLRSLTTPELLAPALALFTDVVAHPSFPGDAVERIRGQMLVGLQRDEEEPATIASRSFMAALYMVHPYAVPPEGTVASVKSLRAEDLRGFHQRFYTARNAVIAIAGAVDRDQAAKIAEKFSAALATGMPAPELPVPPAPTGGSFHVKFDSKQTHILIGLPAIRRNDPDEAALEVANQVLGGDGLTSLLGEEIRNKRGLAYSAGSSFRAMRSVGPFSIQMQTRNDAAGEALGVSLETVRQFAKTGPTPQQFEDARRQLVGSYPLQLAGNSAIVSTLGMLGFYGLPDDYLEQQLSKIEKLSAEDVRAAFARHVPIDRLMVVTLGPEKPVARITPPKPGAAPRPAQ